MKVSSFLPHLVPWYLPPDLRMLIALVQFCTDSALLTRTQGKLPSDDDDGRPGNWNTVAAMSE